MTLGASTPDRCSRSASDCEPDALRCWSTHCIRSTSHMILTRCGICHLLLLFVMLLQGCTIPRGLPTEYGPSGEGANDIARRCGPTPEVPPYIYRDHKFQAVRVVVEFDHLPSNETARVRVLEGSGIQELDDAAVQAVSKWKCSLPDRWQHQSGVVIPFRFVNPLNPPPPITASVMWAGEYTAESRAKVMTPGSFKGYTSNSKGIRYGDATSVVVGKLEAAFGVRLIVVDVVPKDRQSLRIVWKFPPVGLVNPSTGMRHFGYETARACLVGEPCLISWVMTEEWERVPGTWTLEVWLHDRMVASQAFDVVLQ